MAAAPPDKWQEVFLVGIQEMDGSFVEYAGITEDITEWEIGDKEFEGKPMANGGRRASWTPQGDGTITLKITPIDAKLDGNGMIQLFNPQTADDSTDPIKVLNTRNRNKYQIVLTWAEDLLTTISNTTSATTADKQAYRVTAKNAYVVKHKHDMGDKEHTAEVTFKWPAFGKTGNSNYKEESTESTAIPAPSDFTTANQWSAF